MPSNNQMVELKSLVMTSKDNNEIVERLKSFLERMNKEIADAVEEN